MINKIIVFLWLIVFTIIGAFLAYFFRANTVIDSENVYTKNGEYDLSSVYSRNFSIIKINSEAKFYSDTFLYKHNFSKSSELPKSSIVRIPSKWNKLKNDTIKRPGLGYGTYYFKINLPEKGLYGLKINNIKSAFRIIVNDSILGGSGKVGKSKQEMIPSRYQKEFYFQADTSVLEVLMHVSNFHHRNGGITGSIFFGQLERISFWKATQVAIETFLIGVLFILFIYHLVLYAYRRKDKSILYFSLLCLTMFFRAGYIGERLFLEAFHYINWAISIRIEYISIMSIPIFTALFLKNMFPKEFHQWLVWCIISFSLFFIFIILFFSSYIFSYTPLLLQYILGPFSAYLLVMIFVAFLRKREYALQLFLGFLVFFILSIHDSLYYHNVIESIYLMPLGLFVVTLSHAYVLAQKSSSAHSRSELLASELQVYADNLEKLVADRTVEIENQKQKIETQKESIELAAEELKTTNKNLIKLADFKKNMTQMMIHDLKNPLNNIIGFSNFPGDITRFKSHIHASGWNMLNLVENILDVEKSETSELKINKKPFNLKNVINSAYKNTEYMFNIKAMRFYNEVAKEQIITADENLIKRVISNILSNAAKYADRGNYVKISSAFTSSNNNIGNVKINIFNNGPAIPKERQEIIFEKFNHQFENKSNGYHSSGIGLAFCRHAVNAHKGKIGVTSGEDFGVTFWFTLPV